jgi:hypothetical protein
MSLGDVEPADLTDPLVAFLDLLTHVPRTAPDFPFVHAGIAAERAAWRLDEAVAPPANRLTGGVAFRLSPLLRGDHTGSAGTHAMGYRRK